MWQKDWENKIISPVIDFLWSSWNRLGFYGTGPALSTSPDPEILLALSILLHPYEKRLMIPAETWLGEFNYFLNGEKLFNVITGIINLCGDSNEIKSLFAPVLLYYHPNLRNKLARNLKISLPEKWSYNPLPNGTKKFHSPDKIVNNNPLISLRAFIGTGFRADILHQIALHCFGSKNQTLTHTQISSLIFTNRMTAYRILKELEMCGVCRTQAHDKKTKHFLINDSTPYGQMIKRIEQKEKNYPEWRHIIFACAETLTTFNRCKEIKNIDIIRSHLAHLSVDLESYLKSATGKKIVKGFPQDTPLKNIKPEFIVNYLKTTWELLL